jgi:DNA-binding transcriptional LysR family regulator
MSWDDARILLAVMRCGTQATASKVLGIDQATVSRRLLRLEDSVGSALFLRDGTRLVPTEAAQRMAERAEEAEASLSSLGAQVGTDSAGTVRIAAPHVIASHVLAPALPLLQNLSAGVVAELIAMPESASLTRRDADIALRLTKPGNGGFLARRIAMVHYQVFVRRGADPDKLPWIGFDETLAELPEARWMARHEPVLARVADLHTMYQAVRAGVGRALLPVALAKRDGAVVPLPTPEAPTRELWLLVERRIRQVRRVSLALGWVEALIYDAFPGAANGGS